MHAQHGAVCFDATPCARPAPPCCRNRQARPRLRARPKRRRQELGVERREAPRDSAHIPAPWDGGGCAGPRPQSASPRAPHLPACTTDRQTRPGTAAGAGKPGRSAGIPESPTGRSPETRDEPAGPRARHRPRARRLPGSLQPQCPGHQQPRRRQGPGRAPRPAGPSSPGPSSSRSPRSRQTCASSQTASRRGAARSSPCGDTRPGSPAAWGQGLGEPGCPPGGGGRAGSPARRLAADQGRLGHGAGAGPGRAPSRGAEVRGAERGRAGLAPAPERPAAGCRHEGALCPRAAGRRGSAARLFPTVPAAGRGRAGTGAKPTTEPGREPCLPLSSRCLPRS